MQLRYFILGLMLILPLGAAQAESSTTITAADILPLKKKSDKGDADAQYRLGIAYLSGMGGLTADPLRGMDYIEKSGKAGKREAQFFMGAMLHGINARTNFSDQNKTKEQLKWLALSFRQGCAGSAGLIAGYYVTMKGPESPKALEWFMKAAKGGGSLLAGAVGKNCQGSEKPGGILRLDCVDLQGAPGVAVGQGADGCADERDERRGQTKSRSAGQAVC